MKMRFGRTASILGLAGISLTGLTLNATPLSGTILTAPGSTVVPGLVAPGTLPGTLLATLFAPYSFTTTAGTTSGSLASAVYRNTAGTLDFYYQIANSASSATSIARETDVNFAGFETYTGYRVDGGALGAGFVNGTVSPVTADRNASGTTIGFSFSPPDSGKILQGLTSAVLIISTNATLFGAGNASVIDGGTQTVASFQPTGTPVTTPEPASALLIGVGLLGLAVRKVHSIHRNPRGF